MSKTLDQILAERPEVQQTLERERAYMEAYMLIIKLMDEQGVTKAELARRLGRSRPYVTKLLNGSTNMTIRTIADVLFHLGCRLEVASSKLTAAPADNGGKIPPPPRNRRRPKSPRRLPAPFPRVGVPAGTIRK